MEEPTVKEIARLWLRQPAGRIEARTFIDPLTVLLEVRVPHLKPLALLAAQGDAEAAYEVAAELTANVFMEDCDPVGRGWMWVAACMGSRRARLAMTELLLIHSEQLGPLFGIGVSARAFDWFPLARTKFRVTATGGLPEPPDRTPKPTGLAALAGASDNASELADDGEDAGPRHRAITEIGASKSGEGKAIAERWKRLTEPLPLLGGDVDPEWLEARLVEEMPWAAAAARAVADDMRLVALSGRPYFWCRPTVLVGPAGVGKTHFFTTMARLLGMPWSLVNLGASSDSRMLSGTARGWHSAQPMFPLVAMLAGEPCGNPILIADEVDKVGTSRLNGNAWDALLAYLEPASARQIMDECLLTRADVSTCVWCCTANDLSPLPDPLLSRLSIIRIGAPEANHFDALLRGLRRDLAATLKLDDPRLLPHLDAGDVAWLREVFIGTGRSVRKLKRAFERITALRGRNEADARRRPH